MSETFEIINNNKILNNYKQIIETEQFNVYQNKKNKALHSITIPQQNRSLIESIVMPKFISGAFTTDNDTKLFFNASSVKLFSHYRNDLLKINKTSRLPVNIISQIINNLSTQLYYLIKKQNKCFLGYNPNNLIVICNRNTTENSNTTEYDTDNIDINDYKFIYIDTEYLLPINPLSEQICLTFPFSLNDFYMSPELFDIKEIPSQIHYRTSYYSLGCLFLHLLNDEQNPNLNPNISKNKHTYHNLIDEQLNNIHIKDTKLFFLLKRSLDIDERKRSLLFI